VSQKKTSKNSPESGAGRRSPEENTTSFEHAHVGEHAPCHVAQNRVTNDRVKSAPSGLLRLLPVTKADGLDPSSYNDEHDQTAMSGLCAGGGLRHGLGVLVPAGNGLPRAAGGRSLGPAGGHGNETSVGVAKHKQHGLDAAGHCDKPHTNRKRRRQCIAHCCGGCSAGLAGVAGRLVGLLPSCRHLLDVLNSTLFSRS